MRVSVVHVYVCVYVCVCMYVCSGVDLWVYRLYQYGVSLSRKCAHGQWMGDQLKWLLKEKHHWTSLNLNLHVITVWT